MKENDTEQYFYIMNKSSSSKRNNWCKTLQEIVSLTRNEVSSIPGFFFVFFLYGQSVMVCYYLQYRQFRMDEDDARSWSWKVSWTAMTQAGPWRCRHLPSGTTHYCPQPTLVTVVSGALRPSLVWGEVAYPAEQFFWAPMKQQHHNPSSCSIFGRWNLTERGNQDHRPRLS